MTTTILAVVIAAALIWAFRTSKAKDRQDKEAGFEESVEAKELKEKPKQPPEPELALAVPVVEVPQIPGSQGEEVLTERRVKALYKLATQILEDDEVDLAETRKLRDWLRRYPESKDDWRTEKLCALVDEVLEDRVLDHDEALEVFALLSDYCEYFEQKTVAEEAKQQGTKASKAAERAQKQQQARDEKKAEQERERIKSVKPALTPSSAVLLDQLESKQTYLMGYQDSKGQVTEREIIFKQADVNGQGQQYVKAFCLLRNRIRTFRADRIEWMCDIETGEEMV